MCVIACVVVVGFDMKIYSFKNFKKDSSQGYQTIKKVLLPL